MLVSTCGTTVEGDPLRYDYVDADDGGPRLSAGHGRAGSYYQVSWPAPRLVNDRTLAQPWVDAVLDHFQQQIDDNQ